MYLKCWASDDWLSKGCCCYYCCSCISIELNVWLAFPDVLAVSEIVVLSFSLSCLLDKNCFFCRFGDWFVLTYLSVKNFLMFLLLEEEDETMKFFFFLFKMSTADWRMFERVVNCTLLSLLGNFRGFDIIESRIVDDCCCYRFMIEEDGDVFVGDY